MPRDFSEIPENVQLALAWCDSTKKNAVCKECHDHAWRRLQFHHRNPEEKEYDVGFMVREGFPLDMIFAEAAKCDLTCHDCHQKIHQEWRERGYWPKRPEATQERPVAMKARRRDISMQRHLGRTQLDASPAQTMEGT